MVLGGIAGSSVGNRFFGAAYLLTRGGRRSVAGYTEDRPYRPLAI
jgi:hypothetical protein